MRSARTTTSLPISRRATIPGTSDCASCPTAICSGDPRPARFCRDREIETFTPKGIRLKDGSEVEADLVVTATGLEMQVLGGIEVSVDGAPSISQGP